MASAAGTSGKSSATIKRSRGAIVAACMSPGVTLDSCMSPHLMLGNLDQLPHQRIERLDIGGMFQSIHIIIGLAGERQRQLTGNHQRVAGGKNKPQRRQRARSAAP